MKYTIVFLFAMILSCGLVRAVEFHGSKGQSPYLGGSGSPTVPSSQRTVFSGNNNGPILRAVDPGDDGDDFNQNPYGEDGTENVNDNNKCPECPVSNGILIIALASIIYTLGLGIKRRKKLKNINKNINLD